MSAVWPSRSKVRIRVELPAPCLSGNTQILAYQAPVNLVRSSVLGFSGVYQYRKSCVNMPKSSKKKKDKAADFSVGCIFGLLDIV